MILFNISGYFKGLFRIYSRHFTLLENLLSFDIIFVSLLLTKFMQLVPLNLFFFFHIWKILLSRKLLACNFKWPDVMIAKQFFSNWPWDNYTRILRIQRVDRFAVFADGIKECLITRELPGINVQPSIVIRNWNGNRLLRISVYQATFSGNQWKSGESRFDGEKRLTYIVLAIRSDNSRINLIN